MGAGGGESPQELRELARRVRVIARAYDGEERERLLSYAQELEARAAELERDDS